jgi:hypothetical protein
MKEFNVKFNVGRCKYLVSFHDGSKTHSDGSKFFDVALFKSKTELEKFTNKLTAEGYVKN